ncbi:MAG: phenylalanine--tRNA ligase beta subunit-related protein [Anaerolineales bacterium]|nr:phenylalanine--tRNA ligase beta subunit-related protein [Anaerolineales bacterium]
MKISIGSTWHQAPTGARVGVLIMNEVANPLSHPRLEAHKAELERELRRRYARKERADLRAEPRPAAYDHFYRQFKKTYHLQLQLESVCSGRPISSVATLVEAMIMAELEDLLLTAGHDLDTVHPPIQIEVADGTEAYTTMKGEMQTLKCGDLFIHDAEGVLSSLIYGPDRRSRIRPETKHVLFTTYAVPGIWAADLLAHLKNLRDHVLLIAPEADVEYMGIVGD